MGNAPREQLGFGPWQRFPRNAVFFAALLVNVVLAINLWNIVPARTGTGLAFVEQTLPWLLRDGSGWQKEGTPV